MLVVAVLTDKCMGMLKYENGKEQKGRKRG